MDNIKAHQKSATNYVDNPPSMDGAPTGGPSNSDPAMPQYRTDGHCSVTNANIGVSANYEDTVNEGAGFQGMIDRFLTAKSQPYIPTAMPAEVGELS